jgi:hypothetical protein
MDFVNGRSMELLARLGLAEPLRTLGVPADQAFIFLWLRGLDEPPLSRWFGPSVDQVRRQIARYNDGAQPREPYQRVLGSLLEETGRAACAANDLVDLRVGSTLRALRTETAGVDRIATEVGPPEVLVNTIGAYHPGQALTATPADLRLMIDVNTGTAFWLIHP